MPVQASESQMLGQERQRLMTSKDRHASMMGTHMHIGFIRKLGSDRKKVRGMSGVEKADYFTLLTSVDGSGTVKVPLLLTPSYGGHVFVFARCSRIKTRTNDA